MNRDSENNMRVARSKNSSFERRGGARNQKTDFLDDYEEDCSIRNEVEHASAMQETSK